MTAAEAEAITAEQIASFPTTGPTWSRAHHHIHRRGDRDRSGRARARHALRHLVHGRDRWQVTVGGDAARRSPRWTRRPVRPAYYMVNCAHPTHLDATRSRGRAGRAGARAAGQRFDDEPRRARRGRVVGRRRHRGPRGPVRGTARAASAAERARRLLRHRRTPRQADRPDVRDGRMAAQRLDQGGRPAVARLSAAQPSKSATAAIPRAIAGSERLPNPRAS